MIYFALLIHPYLEVARQCWPYVLIVAHSVLVAFCLHWPLSLVAALAPRRTSPT